MDQTVDRNWKPIPGTREEFWVADDGTVRGPKGDVQPYQAAGREHWLVNAPRKRRLAQLVLEAFGTKPDRPGPWYLVHLDHDRSNCRIDNLRWAHELAYRQHQQRGGTDPWRVRRRERKEEKALEVMELRSRGEGIPLPGKPWTAKTAGARRRRKAGPSRRVRSTTSSS